MGGLDKGLVDWQGRPMAAWVLNAMRPQVDALLISANRNTAQYAALGAEVLADDSPFEGPTAGVQAALGYAAGRWDWIWLAPCDLPTLPGTLAAALHAAAGEAPVVLPRTPDGRLQPVHALLRSDLPPPPPGGSLCGWLLAQGARVLDWPGPLQGFNTLESMR